jgi:hypothetical protein
MNRQKKPLFWVRTTFLFQLNFLSFYTFQLALWIRTHELVVNERKYPIHQTRQYFLICFIDLNAKCWRINLNKGDKNDQKYLWVSDEPPKESTPHFTEICAVPIDDSAVNHVDHNILYLEWTNILIRTVFNHSHAFGVRHCFYI